MRILWLSRHPLVGYQTMLLKKLWKDCEVIERDIHLDSARHAEMVMNDEKADVLAGVLPTTFIVPLIRRNIYLIRWNVHLQRWERIQDVQLSTVAPEGSYELQRLQ